MRLTAALATACLLAAGSVGCGGDDTGGDQAAESGLVFAEGVSMPDGFPAEVPLIEQGEVTDTEGGTEGSRGWEQFRVVVESTEPYADLETAAVGRLTDAGFEVLGEEDSSEGYFVQTYKLGVHVVLLGLQESTDDPEVSTTVQYLVTVIPETGLPAPETIVPLADGLIFEVTEDGPIQVEMLVETSVEQAVADVEAQLTAAGFPTNPDYPVTTEDDGAMHFTATSDAASVALWVVTDYLTGLTHLAYDIYEN